MYLKSVEIQGFKSFADKIYLNFNPGITAIVGPNGSGKSNISDAIRWVMGEQSVKSLRGSRMEDVIFSGTEVRKPQGFAEVSLTIDNSQKIFPLDYEEVVVTRRVYRSGEGEYFINRNACRLKDIHELFMDTGLGREGYSIIGQGKIDEILSNKSEERRHIFEEAAGITKYKYRKNEAERKLERTNDNLTRVNDIMTELEGQLAPLKSQSEKAKKYLALRDELKEIEVNTSVVSIEKLKEDLKKAEEDYSAVSESIDVMQKTAEKDENQVNELYSKMSDYDNRIEELRHTKEENAEKTSDGANSITLSLANIEHLGENVERINEEIEKSKRGIAQLDEIIASYNDTLIKIKEEGAGILNEKQSLEKEIESLNDLLLKETEAVESLKSDIIDKTAEINSNQSKIVNYGILLENFRTEYENAKESLEKQNEGYKDIFDENAKLTTRLNELEKLLKTAQKEADDADNEYKTAAERTSDLIEKKSVIQTELGRCTSKKSVLEDMENDFDGYNRSVKAVMTAHSGGALKNLNIYGPVSKLVTTDKKYVTAIETAMMSVGQNIVTKDEQDAKRAIEYLKSNHLGRATFMPVSTVKARTMDASAHSKLKGYIAVASDLVEYDGLFDGIVKNILGATVVADNIDNAISMAKITGHKFRIVTLDGEIMQPGGAMSGGSVGKNSGFLSRKAEIDNLSETIEKLNCDLEKVEKDKADTAQLLIKASERTEKARAVLFEKNEEYIKAKSEAEHSSRYLSEIEERKDALLKDMDTATVRTKEINEDIENCKKRINDLESEIVTLKGNTEGKQSETDKVFESVQKLQESLVAITVKENANIKDKEHQEERIQTVVSEKNGILTEVKEKMLQIDGFNQKISELQAEVEESRKNLDSLTARSLDIDREIEELSGLRKEADVETRKIQEGLKETREKLFMLGQKKVKAETKKANIEADLDGIFAHLWDEYELTYTEALKIRTDADINLTEANREIASLKSKIKGLGSINIDAIEEYKNVKERFDFLTEQMRDLEKAKGEIENLITEMQDIMKKQFEEQFAIISKNFNQVFRELFGGGQATLSLADPDDILESGVEIEAQPPGKKLQSLSLLSGGEKAFTAIALLFAILKVRPTPFCILDEIEAALDDVNVYRFADYLKKYSSKTQFIVVTHRRGTMEVANILYGVTMQEKGISKLIALNIDEVAE